METNTFVPSRGQMERIVKKFGTPTFVTDASTLHNRVRSMRSAFSIVGGKIFYALKANYNPHIVSVIKRAGAFGIDAVSPYEVRWALTLGFLPKQILFTGNSISDEEMRFVASLGVRQNVGSLSELERFGRLFPGEEISIRLSPGIGAGENEKISTGGKGTKFGIIADQFEEVKKILDHFHLRLVGIHSHIGSGFYDTRAFSNSVKAVCSVAKSFSSLEFLDFGGGYGVQYYPEKKNIDLSDFARSIQREIQDFSEVNGKRVDVYLEPGKYLVAQSTILLVTVTTVKEKNGKIFVGTDSGFNHLIRPAMYGAYHHVVNISGSRRRKKRVSVVGNVCETCDTFNDSILLNNPREGDILAILTAGAYGASMSSNYNMRPMAAEVLIDGEKIQLTRRRQSFESIVDDFIWKEKAIDRK